MSWWGTHPVLSREQAKANLPPGACKRCIYWERCQLFIRKPQYYDACREGCSRCQSLKNVKYGPFNDYQNDLFKILGAIQQSGRYLWSVDLPCSLALQGLIRRKIVTFKEQVGNLASYVPTVKSYLRFEFK